jgi:hypothetical protein
MPTDPRKRQKKLERRTAKRQEKKHGLVKKQEAGLAERLSAATKYPVLQSRVSEDFWKSGIGWVLLSRQLPGGSVAVAVFLVDRFCLGVKDAFAKILGGFTYEKDYLRGMGSKFTWRDVSPATARKLVEDAVAYAASFGIPPHADYHKAKPIFGAIDASESTDTFEFGENGKPHFVAGPNDTRDRCRQILAILTHKCGPGGFHYTIPLLDNISGVLPAGREQAEWQPTAADGERGQFDDPADEQDMPADRLAGQ